MKKQTKFYVLIYFIILLCSGNSIVDRPLTDISNIITALKAYHIQHKHYPNSLKDIVGAEEFYLEALPFDPWEQPYIYEHKPDSSIVVYTLGKDAKLGGESENKDRGSWELEN